MALIDCNVECVLFEIFMSLTQFYGWPITTRLTKVCPALCGPSIVLDTKTEWRVLIDNLPPGDVKHSLFVWWVSITTLGSTRRCRPKYYSDQQRGCQIIAAWVTHGKVDDDRGSTKSSFASRSVIGQRNVTFDTVGKGQARGHQTVVLYAL